MANRLENDLIEWWPWSQEALTKAKEENKAIFIFIGYPSCHLCNIMQEEIFKNKEVAKIVNENFISIKINAQERPDIDKYYQKVYKLLNRCDGGWPLSIFLTPQNKPFFARAYIPLQSTSRDIEKAGFVEVAELIAQRVKTRDETLLKNANEIENFIKQRDYPKKATRLKEDFYKIFLTQTRENYDTRNGGFGKKPKFLYADILQTLIEIDKRYGDKSAKAMVVTSLKKMANGAVFDKKNGGFYRYTDDEKWLLPNFEKMLYDNGLLCGVYSDAYLLYKEKKFLEVASKTADFCCNHMSKNHLFFSVIDEKKEPPFIDKQIQTSWSAIVINSLFKLGEIEKKYNKKAIDSLDALLNATYKEKKLYHTALIEKEAGIEAFLEDYAFLSQALLLAHNKKKERFYLLTAQKLINTALEKFYKEGLWNFSNKEFATEADATDRRYRSCISVMVANLLTLSKTLKEEKYRHFAFKTLQYNSYDLARRPIYYPSMLTETLRYLTNSF